MLYVGVDAHESTSQITVNERGRSDSPAKTCTQYKRGLQGSPRRIRLAVQSCAGGELQLGTDVRLAR